MNALGALIMTAIVSVGFTPESEALLKEWDRVDSQLIENLDRAFFQFISEIEAKIMHESFAGGPGKGGGQTPIGIRSGSLRQSITGQVDGTLSGYVGARRGPASAYARAILGPGQTTIRPVRAKKLWIPIAENLTPSGNPRFSPRGLFAAFGPRVKIFESKAGNTVVFVEAPRTSSGARATYKRAAGTSRRGDVKGKLYFVLKDQVIIQGTDALAQGARNMLPRGQKLIEDAIRSAFPGGGGPSAI